MKEKIMLWWITLFLFVDHVAPVRQSQSMHHHIFYWRQAKTLLSMGRSLRFQPGRSTILWYRFPPAARGRQLLISSHPHVVVAALIFRHVCHYKDSIFLVIFLDTCGTHVHFASSKKHLAIHGLAQIVIAIRSIIFFKKITQHAIMKIA
jgi:hypothetical protein